MKPLSGRVKSRAFVKPTTKHEQSKIYGFRSLDETVKHDAAGQISALYIYILKKRVIKVVQIRNGVKQFSAW